MVEEFVSEFFKDKKIAIIGGCTTRDIMRFLKPKEIKYFARTSFISLTSAPVEINEKEINISGNFEKRMVLSDFDKRALSEITEFKPDILIVDLLAERFAVVNVDGSYVTNSSLLIKSGALSERNDCKVIKRKDAHDLWFAACEKIIPKLVSLECKIILHKAWWASKYMDQDDGQLKSFSDVDIKRVESNNSYLKSYYDTMIRMLPSISVVEAEDSLIYSDFAHQWGKDFYHYSPTYYRVMAEKLVDICESNFDSTLKNDN